MQHDGNYYRFRDSCIGAFSDDASLYLNIFTLTSKPPLAGIKRHSIIVTVATKKHYFYRFNLPPIDTTLDLLINSVTA